MDCSSKAIPISTNGEEMTKIELASFQNALKNEYAELKQGTRNRGALVIEASADELDRIQDAQVRDLTIDTLDRDSKRLREILAALGRVDAGTFGVCLDCEEDISGKRLAAIPWTAKCIGCQEAADREPSQYWSAIEDNPLLSAA
jgi:DnaK suppressor protein